MDLPRLPAIRPSLGRGGTVRPDLQLGAHLASGASGPQGSRCLPGRRGGASARGPRPHGGQPAGRSAAASAHRGRSSGRVRASPGGFAAVHAAAVALPVTGSSSTDERQADIDLVVVGAGAGGMVAALVAALEGLRVVLCEGSQQVGGTTATSAGTLWIPGNRHGAEAGHADSVQAAASYLDALIGPDDGRQLRQAFLESGDAAIAYLEERTDEGDVGAGQHPDYLALPGAAIAGRALAPRPFDGRLLRGAFARIRPPMPEFLLLGGMMVGKALVARLFYSLQRAGVDVRFGWRLRELTVEGGKVRGATFAVDGQERRLDSRAGVVLATGGVGHGEALRAELAPAGMSLPSLACDAVNGEGITAARSAGAGFERYAAGDFFWQPVSRVPRPGGPGLFPHLFLDRAKPGLVAVDAQGRRFADEAGSYHHFVEAMVRHLQRTGGDAAWLVCDAAFVHKYGLGVILPGTRRLDRWIRQGYVCVADRLPALAQRAGIDPAGLLATVQRTNDYAATGRDPDFHKGDAPVDRFNGDPAHRPNPCLGEIGQPPFVALRILPADAASSSGLPIDADGRVLDRAGRVVVGLYACGNDAASVMRGTYPGPGTTQGTDFDFAWRAALFAARRAG